MLFHKKRFGLKYGLALRVAYNTTFGRKDVWNFQIVYKKTIIKKMDVFIKAAKNYCCIIKILKYRKSKFFLQKYEAAV
jgi:hypothetical protein